MTKSPSSKMQIAEKIEIKLASQNKMVNSTGTNIVTNEFNHDDYVINKNQTALSLASLQATKQNILTAGQGISIINDVISSQSTTSYTYIVDSNQKLSDWANNVAGNDYSSVLIKRGTWTTTGQINLTTTGTKVVIGEPGSLLKFTYGSYSNTSKAALTYDTNPRSNNTGGYYMMGVNIEVTGNNTGTTGYVRGFYKCCNLIACSCVITYSHNGAYDMRANAFAECFYVSNCYGYSSVTTTGSTTYRGAYVFSGCYYLVQCQAYSICNGSSTNNEDQAFGSSYCLIGCFAAAGVTRNCYGVTQCRMNGPIYLCYSVDHCYAPSFPSSYASRTATSTYLCADTPNGGFNTTTT